MPDLSIIIPAYNEEKYISLCLDHILRACKKHLQIDESFHLDNSTLEIIVSDNNSKDQTKHKVKPYTEQFGVKYINCTRQGAAHCRNFGAEHAKGEIYIFVDADTCLSEDTVTKTFSWIQKGKHAGLCLLKGDSNTISDKFWWFFWNQVRRLPIPRAKAMPAYMFCSKEAFIEHGPFDTQVQVGEEWPILVGVYKKRCSDFIYDRQLYATSSSRRMTMQKFGYLRLYLKYLWAILHFKGRLEYNSKIR